MGVLERRQVIVAALEQAGYGVLPSEDLAGVLARIRDRVLELLTRQSACWRDDVRPALAREGIVVIKRAEWTPAQREFCRQFFENEVQAVVTPIALDPRSEAAPANTSSRRPQRSTRPPPATMARAHANPMPLPPPVTMADCPSKRPIEPPANGAREPS